MNLTDGVTSYDFKLLPHRMGMIRPVKHCASKKTYTSVAFFSWDVSIVGKEIDFLWPAMPASMWKKLDEFYAGNKTLIWDPTLTGTPAAKKYNVEMKWLDGEYLLGGYDEELPTSYRGDVTMTLLILSEVT